MPRQDHPRAPKPVLLDAARPVLFVRNVRAAAEFYRDRLGFRVDFLPPFYGSVSRDDATLHLRFVHEPVLAADTARDEGLIMAFIEARNVKELYAEYLAAGVELAQKLTKQAWGGTDFIVRDLDGNTVAFVG
jgi:catechol 2,3-dioxygenase-like lactoylglutathione lyase family enzyme